MRSIFLTLPLFILIFSAPVYAQQETYPASAPFRISSVGSGFGVQGTFEGEYRLYADRIEVTVARATIYISRTCPYQGRRDVTSLVLGLATGMDGDRWDIRWRSERVPINRVMSPGEEYTLEGLYFIIPRNEATDLGRHWLVFVMEDITLDAGEAQRRPGEGYAHSRRNIFSPR